MNAVSTLDIDTWTPAASPAGDTVVAHELEAGRVLYLPHLRFVFQAHEEHFLDSGWFSAAGKSISLEAEGAALAGAKGPSDQLLALSALMGRFRAQAVGLIERLFPRYAAELRPARTSYRPGRLAAPAVHWRTDDARLHVDAFPSRPVRGDRILRVFANVSPLGEPRVWRIGEPFEQLITRFLSRLSRPVPGMPWLLRALRVTTSPRSEYDHMMLCLHDAMKRDLEYQRQAPQTTVSFAAGTVWICFSDQIPHAAMAGQFMLEQTLHLPVRAQLAPELSPLRTLERRTGRVLV